MKESAKVTPEFTSKRKLEPPLPRPFGVPQNFPYAITEGLKNEKLVGKPRTKFVTIIAQSIYRFKNYPSEEEFCLVIQDLVKKWPFLDNRKGNVCAYYCYVVYMNLFLKCTSRSQWFCPYV